jgi:hypothetical protein
MNSGSVDRTSHDAVKRIDLPNQVPFAQPPDRRIAGHHTDRVEPMRNQRDPRSEPRGSRCSLGSGMTAADNDNIEGLARHARSHPCFT